MIDPYLYPYGSVMDGQQPSDGTLPGYYVAPGSSVGYKYSPGYVDPSPNPGAQAGVTGWQLVDGHWQQKPDNPDWAHGAFDLAIAAPALIGGLAGAGAASAATGSSGAASAPASVPSAAAGGSIWDTGISPLAGDGGSSMFGGFLGGLSRFASGASKGQSVFGGQSNDQGPTTADYYQSQMAAQRAQILSQLLADRKARQEDQKRALMLASVMG